MRLQYFSDRLIELALLAREKLRRFFFMNFIWMKWKYAVNDEHNSRAKQFNGKNALRENEVEMSLISASRLRAFVASPNANRFRHSSGLFYANFFCSLFRLWSVDACYAIILWSFQFFCRAKWNTIFNVLSIGENSIVSTKEGLLAFKGKEREFQKKKKMK